jgi:hypothetical protein
MSTRLLLFFAWAASTSPAFAQWEIFAQRMPEDGSWATYRVTRKSGKSQPQISEIRISTRDGTVVEKTPCVWLEISPVKWLGSRNKGRLSFLIPRAMDATKAGRLLFISYEILFTDPVKGPWHLMPADVNWLVEKVELKSSSTLTPDGTAKMNDGSGKEHDCTLQKLESKLSIDPPFAAAQTTDLVGKVWRDETAPFGIIRAEWTETLKKGDETEVETKIMELMDSGKDPAAPSPIDHGDGFSLWRLIRR